MPGTKVAIYSFRLKRAADNPQEEVWIRASLALRYEMPDEQAEEIFLGEMRHAWQTLHRAIRKHEVGEE